MDWGVDFWAAEDGYEWEVYILFYLLVGVTFWKGGGERAPGSDFFFFLIFQFCFFGGERRALRSYSTA